MRWIIKQVDQQKVEFLSQEAGISLFLAKILVNRGIEDPKIVNRFLKPSILDLHDPFLLRDMDRVVELLLKAREENIPVLIYGDYDADGITGIAVYKEFLDRYGWVTDYYIPKRMDEGYGIQPAVIEQFFKKFNKGIVLTVDCGITAIEAVEFAKKFNCLVLITDHHEVGEQLPDAAAVVDPKRPDDDYPFKDLAGVGVAFKVVSAISQKLNIQIEEIFDLLEFVAIGTIADMVKLVDENRFMVKTGLEKLKRTGKPGLSILFKRLGINEPDSRDIGYRVAPKLNAAGRLDSADDAFELLISRDETSAEKLVNLLFEYNSTRQEIESEIFMRAVEQIEERGLHKDPIIVVKGDNWHVGVIGIVATRLVHRYGKPVMVISNSDGIARGSARSIPNLNLIELLQPLSSYFYEFGGHPLAVGFSLDSNNVDDFAELLRNFEIPIEDVPDVLEIDEDLQLEQINEETLKDIGKLEPFGHGNNEPIFVARNVIAESIKFFGQNHANVKMNFTVNGAKIEAIGFGLGHAFDKSIYECNKVDIVFSIRNHRHPFSINIIDFSIIKDYQDTHQATENIEILQKNLHLNHILEQLKGGKLFILDLRTRNALYYWLKEKSKIRCAVISLNNIISSQVHQSLLRHIQKPIEYLNSLCKSGSEDFAFMTMSYFMAEKEEVMKRFDLFFINELSVFTLFQNNSQVAEFLDFVSSNCDKFVAVTVKNPEKLLSFANELGFEVTYERSLKPSYGLTDASNEIDLIINDASCFLFSDQRKLSSFYKKLKTTIKNKEILMYSHSLKPSYRAGIVNYIKRKKPVKLVSSTNTDGLPTLLGQETEIAILDAPLTLFEILDAISYNCNDQLLDLCFTEENVVERENELNELFPSRSVLREIILQIGERKVSQDELMEYVVRQGYFGSFSYARIIKNIFDDLGAAISNGMIDLTKIDFSKKSLREMERELEIEYFAKITRPLLTQKVKGIYRALANVHVVI
ncbi:MAG TPA: single-stranded-DNA-specific exonuclease RecJ [Pseudothermotoga sp.]|uniref:single-stranded-DNA-specific exonuclease RecJ n=1 Tax=Pseudothermotoga lettingae TaxID=177758 RepID=UPI0007492686|nr:single-stranded-DNA-specific exonuclease RecJ [Pseudothermotoga lettingae]KUK21709.1 MAG: Single-stranded-DNA-specific exonuclease RecJ [Pseudothermotoga lettingae]HBT25226.1 single-stranded-DNA-specific exonuclease RecJ [Pseudothermotoga sp.]